MHSEPNPLIFFKLFLLFFYTGAFLCAYRGETPNINNINPLSQRIPLPNWRITFDGLTKIKAIKKYKDDNNLKRPVIKVQGIWPAIKENPTKYYETFAPYVDQVAFNPLIDYLWNDIKDQKEIPYIANFSCPQQYQRMVIGADGLVMKCANDEENKEVMGDVKFQTVHEIWHGEKFKKMREMHNKPEGFKCSEVCKRCYLPRQTKDEVANVGQRKI